MKEKYPLVIAITALITALVAGGLVYWLTGNREAVGNGEKAELEEQVAALQQENAALQEENSTLKEENEALTESREIHRQPKAGWEQYFPDAETTTLEGKSTEEVRQLLGEPPFLVRSTAVNPQNNREVWIYTPFDQDPTGLYLFFKGGQLASSRLDEFPGLQQSFIWEDEDFWQN